MERVIVTGATSMIGEALIEECLKHGISVCAVIRKDTARKDRLPEDPHLELVECSLEELETLPEKVNGTFDTFYHIAWGYTGAARNKSVRLQSKNIDYTLEAVEAAAKLANADSFIRHLPQGYDTVLKGDGGNLSQGQRQLLAIARAAIADPPALILDEATSSIDTRTEKLVQDGMDRLMKGRTTFVIAHRLSTVRNSDCIMVLEQGRIIERGTHDQLIEQQGKYYQLYTGKAGTGLA